MTERKAAQALCLTPGTGGETGQPGTHRHERVISRLGEGKGGREPSMRLHFF